MKTQRELQADFAVEVFDGCDLTWLLQLGEYSLYSHGVPWLKEACKERGIRIGYKNKRDLVESLTEWERSRSAQVMLWGNPRYCQVADAHDPHGHRAHSYHDGDVIDRSYECDGRAVVELGLYAGGHRG